MTDILERYIKSKKMLMDIDGMIERLQTDRKHLSISINEISKDLNISEVMSVDALMSKMQEIKIDKEAGEKRDGK